MIKSEADRAYFAHPALSSHKLADFRKSPNYFLKKHIHGTISDTPSGAMGFGSWVHMACLEPERFDDTVLVAPPECETEVGKLSESVKARKILSKICPEIDRFVSMRECREIEMMANCYRVALSSIVSGMPLDAYEAKTEIPFFLLNKPDIPDLKCKVDLIIGDNIWDIKTIGDLANVRQSIKDFSYLEQLAFYALVSGKKVGGLIFLERGQCPRYQIVNVREETIALKKMEIMDTIQGYQMCLTTGVWPSHPCGPLADESENITI